MASFTEKRVGCMSEGVGRVASFLCSQETALWGFLQGETLGGSWCRRDADLQSSSQESDPVHRVNTRSSTHGDGHRGLPLSWDSLDFKPSSEVLEVPRKQVTREVEGGCGGPNMGRALG